MRNLQYPNSYIVWDLETSGLDKTTGKILEIGCLKIKNGEVVDRRSWFLNHGIEIPLEITKINGITKEMIATQGIDPKDALEEFYIMAVSAAAHITHNGMRFDIEWLAYHVVQTLDWTEERRRILVEQLYCNALDTAVFVKAQKLGMRRGWNESFKEWSDRVMNTRTPGLKYNLSLCCDELGIKRDGITQHRALGDCELTNEIYKKIILTADPK